MSLLRRIEQARPGDVAAPGRVTPRAPGAPPTRPQAPARETVSDLRARLQRRIMVELGPRISVAGTAELRRQIEGLLERIVTEEGLALTRAERVQLLEQISNEISGLGPLEPLVRDETITEVMVNGPRQIYIERAGRLERVNVTFADAEHVMRIIDRIIAPIGRRIDESSPRVDARLSDGSRVNAIIPPLSLIGPVITIRKFSAKPFTVDDLVRFGTATPEMFDFLKACVKARFNIFVSGGTGSGKTTTLNVLSSFIPEDERIVTIEDAAELQLRQPHVITLEARPPNIEGTGAIAIRDLLRNAMHMRPDRIIVGECRGGEALDMIGAMNTGHDGSLSTGHANTPRDMLHRLETMVLMAGYELPLRAIREQIADAVDLIVHTARLKDGSRKVTAITEIQGMEDDDIITKDLFLWEQTGVKDGKIEGELRPTGARPLNMVKFEEAGIRLPPGTFGSAVAEASEEGADRARRLTGYTPVVKAGGMVYVMGMGPVDPETGRVVGTTIQEQTRQCLLNLKARLEEAGSSIERVVWATWSLKNSTEYDGFTEEWKRWFPADSPARYGVPIPAPQRSGVFRVSIGVIAAAE